MLRNAYEAFKIVSHNTHKGGDIIILTGEMRKLKHNQAKYLAQDHSASKWTDKIQVQAV